jgi:hypothetical protein
VKSYHLSISTHNNLVLAFTNTHYKPSLCCLELFFVGSTFHPHLGALTVVSCRTETDGLTTYH